MSNDTDEYPAHWSESAVDAVVNVLEERPDIAGAEFAALEQAAELISSADLLEAATRDEPLTKGSTGQVVVNPGIIEARLARTAAAQILARLTGNRAGAQTNSQRARSAARARWSGK